MAKGCEKNSLPKEALIKYDKRQMKWNLALMAVSAILTAVFWLLVCSDLDVLDQASDVMLVVFLFFLCV